MDFSVEVMKAQHREAVLAMMRTFYASPAVLTNGSEEIFKNDIGNCVNDSPYLEGFIFENEQEIQGYAMVAKSYSTEFGKPCIWIEDLYIKEKFRGQGIGGSVGYGVVTLVARIVVVFVFMGKHFNCFGLSFI